MAKFDIKVEDEKVKARIAELLEASGDVKPAMQAIGRSVSGRIRHTFTAGRSPDGVPWKALKYRRGQPLLDTNRLRASITANAGADFVDIGTNTQYAPYHQFGFGPVKAHTRRVTKAFGRTLKFPVFASVKAHDGGVPARPFLPIDQAGNTDLPAAWSRGVLDVLRRHFGFTGKEA